MFGKKFHTGKSEALRALKLGLENLEERQLLTAVGVIDVPYGPEPAPVVCTAAGVVDESLDLSEVASNAEEESTTWTVNLSSDSETTEGTLRYAIAKAKSGDKITFADSLKGETITLAGTQLTIDKSLTIDASNLYYSETGTPGITIDANQLSRVMYVGDGTNKITVDINGVTITNGKDCSTEQIGYGGGVYVAAYGTLNATNTVISKNSAKGTEISEIIEDKSAIEGTYPGYGGGVYVAAEGTFNATDSTIKNNSVEGGNVKAELGSEGKIDVEYSPCKGGGVYVAAEGTFTATNTTIEENEVKGTEVSSKTVWISKSKSASESKYVTIDGAYPGCGGGVYVDGEKGTDGETETGKYGTFTATDSTIQNNSVEGYIEVKRVSEGTEYSSPLKYSSCGGGVYVAAYGTFKATNTTIAGNAAKGKQSGNDYNMGEGGGVYVYGYGTFTATNSKIQNNQASAWGGGVYVCGSEDEDVDEAWNLIENTTFTATNTIISGNSIDQGDKHGVGQGGGVAVHFGTFTATNTTIAGNAAGYYNKEPEGFTGKLGSAVGYGGGVYCWNSHLYLYNSIIAGNYAEGYLGEKTYFFSSELFVTEGNYNHISARNLLSFYEYCDFENEEYVNLINDGDDSNKNIAPDSEDMKNLFKDQDEDQDEVDYSLGENSVAIDAGNNIYANGTTNGSALIEADLDSNYRIRQGKADSSATVDMGAYEYVNASCPAEIAVTTVDDVVDPTDEQISLREAVLYAAKTVSDTVELVNETAYTVTSAIALDKSIALDGKNAIIDGDGKTRIFEVAANKEVAISDVTLQNGKAGTDESPENGGAIVNNGTLTLTNVNAYNNVATKNGGVVFNADDATLTIIGGAFGQENGANSARNGGAFANYGTMNISSDKKPMEIQYNKAEKFGGAYFGCGTLNVTGSCAVQFNYNTAGSEGGAIYNDVRKNAEGNTVSSGIVSITGANNYFCANESGDRGGAIMSYSTLKISGTAYFMSNNGGEYGGAIDVGSGCEATLGGGASLLTFMSNTAKFGGAIFSTGVLTFESTAMTGQEGYAFAQNTAKSGGAVDACAGTLKLDGYLFFCGNGANGDYAKDQSGLGGAIAIAAETTVAEGTTFNWDFSEEMGFGLNSATYGTCVAVNTKDLGADKFGLNGAPANSYSLFKAKEAEVTSPAATMIPQMIEASAVAATITVDGVSTTFGEEGVTPKALGLGAGTHDALVQYTDADGATSEVYSLVLTVGEGASIDVCETTIANGRGVKFDFNLTKADGRAVSLWEISWGDGTTTRSDNLSNSWMAAHYYAQDGTFDVALKVTYLDGASETFEAFATRTVGTPLTTTALDAAFADVDELFVELESPLVYGPTLLR